LCAAFEKAPKTLPVMLDCDGQRPEGINELRSVINMAQITVEGAGVESLVERAMQSLKMAANVSLQHALVVCVDERMSDSVTLRIVEQAHAASESTMIVLHPGTGTPLDRDRRWMTLLERAAALHPDVRVALRLPPPTGMRNRPGRSSF